MPCCVGRRRGRPLAHPVPVVDSETVDWLGVGAMLAPHLLPPLAISSPLLQPGKPKPPQVPRKLKVASALLERMLQTEQPDSWLLAHWQQLGATLRSMAAGGEPGDGLALVSRFKRDIKSEKRA